MVILSQVALSLSGLMVPIGCAATVSPVAGLNAGIFALLGYLAVLYLIYNEVKVMAYQHFMAVRYARERED